MKDATQVAKHSSSRLGHPLQQGVNAAWWSKPGAQPGRRRTRQPSHRGFTKAGHPVCPFPSPLGVSAQALLPVAQLTQRSEACGWGVQCQRGWCPCMHPAVPCHAFLCRAVPFCAMPLCAVLCQDGTRDMWWLSWLQLPDLADHPRAWPRGRARNMGHCWCHGAEPPLSHHLASASIKRLEKQHLLAVLEPRAAQV